MKLVVQVCLEGEISRSSIMNNLSQGRRAAGDLIPWTVSEQFQDHNFASLSGARIVSRFQKFDERIFLQHKSALLKYV